MADQWKMQDLNEIGNSDEATANAGNNKEAEKAVAYEEKKVQEAKHRSQLSARTRGMSLKMKLR